MAIKCYPLHVTVISVQMSELLEVYTEMRKMDIRLRVVGDKGSGIE
jgi:hypothetical protein